MKTGAGGPIHSRQWQRLFICLTVFCSTCLYMTSSHRVFPVVRDAAILALLAFLLCSYMIPVFAIELKSHKLSGKDLGKFHWQYREALFGEHPLKPAILPDIVRKNIEPNVTKEKAQEEFDKLPEVPESLGVVVVFTFLVASLLCHFRFGENTKALLDYTAGLFSIAFMSFLGFVDDVVDLRWRYKVVLPIFAALPLLSAYTGPTTVLVPEVMKPLVGKVFSLPTDSVTGLMVWDLGLIYYIYMGLLTIFCTNSINIYAGLNGLEVGQAIIICLGLTVYNLAELSLMLHPETAELELIQSRQTFSLVMNLCFLGCTLAVYHYNQYPSEVFIGDTFTYFSGVFFAVSGVVGHCSKTILLLFLPQIMNFLYSLPQLIGIFPCPRHRLPFFDRKSKKLFSNGSLTFLNLALKIFGPLTEKQLVRRLLILQAVCCFLGLMIRHSSFWSVIFT